jgi:adenylate cyclase class IV
MKHLNIELKAKSSNQDEIRKILNENNAKYEGLDHQIDIYYNSEKGRLKLRKGNIENTLIYYERENTADSKQSNIILHHTKPNSNIVT